MSWHMVVNVMFVSLNGCFMTPFRTRKRWIIHVMVISMMEGLNSPSGQFRPHQASCAASAISPAEVWFFFNLQEGNPDFVYRSDTHLCQ